MAVHTRGYTLTSFSFTHPSCLVPTDFGTVFPNSDSTGLYLSFIITIILSKCGLQCWNIYIYSITWLLSLNVPIPHWSLLVAYILNLEKIFSCVLNASTDNTQFGVFLTAPVSSEFYYCSVLTDLLRINIWNRGYLLLVSALGFCVGYWI